MTDDFRQRLTDHVAAVAVRAERATTEAATSQYLILPFFQVLGYDPLNPDEVVPESHASFSEKFKNRVDYAIHVGGVPVIAVECKCAGKLSEANRGELKGYFNAVPTVKLGILTDGVIYELYSDTARENMMDDEPFVRVDFGSRVTEPAVAALEKLRKGVFQPASVAADARRKIFTAAYVDAFEGNLKSPTEGFVRALLDAASVDGRRTGKMVEEHTPIIADAFQAFLDKKILERVGFADRENLVKVEPTSVAAPVAPPAEIESGVVTTSTELRVFDYVRMRLSFLVKDEALYSAIAGIGHIDRKTVFIVFYKQERKGRLFNFYESPDGTLTFEFPDVESMQTRSLSDIDVPLLKTFKRRVEESG